MQTWLWKVLTVTGVYVACAVSLTVNAKSSSTATFSQEALAQEVSEQVEKVTEEEVERLENESKKLFEAVMALEAHDDLKAAHEEFTAMTAQIQESEEGSVWLTLMKSLQNSKDEKEQAELKEKLDNIFKNSPTQLEKFQVWEGLHKKVVDLNKQLSATPEFQAFVEVYSEFVKKKKAFLAQSSSQG